MTKEQDLVKALKNYHNAQFTPDVWVHSIFGKAAITVESLQSTIINLNNENAMLEADNANLQAEVDRYSRLFHSEHDIANALQVKSEALEKERDAAVEDIPRKCVTCGKRKGWETCKEASFISDGDVCLKWQYRRTEATHD